MWTWIRGILFLAGLVILIVLMVQIGTDRVVELIASTGWTLALIPLIYGGCQLARAAALWLCLPPESAVPYRDVLAARVSAEAVRLLTFTGPFLAEPSKVWLLRRRGLDTKAGVAGIVAEILAHSLLATAISIAALAYLLTEFPLRPPVRTGIIVLMGGMGAYVTVAVIAIWRRIYLIGAGAGVLWRMGLLGFVRDLRDVRETEDLLLSVFHDRPARFCQVVAYHGAANLCLVLEVVVAVGAMGFAISALHALMIEGSLKFVSVAFFFIPTQVGASEGAYALLFDVLGYGSAAGLSFALIRRLRTLAVATIGFVVGSVLGIR